MGLFRYCERLEKVNLVGDITVIGSYAFYGCESLKYSVIPESVKGIGKFAFYECTALKNVIFEDAAGWSRIYTEEGSAAESLAEEAVADTQSVAKLLVQSTSGYYWYSYVWTKAVAQNGDLAE